MSVVDRIVPVGVVGVGHLGSIHARVYAGLTGVRLVGVVDRDPERAKAVARDHGCEVFADVSDLAEKVEAASVAVPTEVHPAVAVPLLEAGVHVLVEKPIARTVDEADAIVAAGERCNRRIMVGHSERFNPAAIALAREVSRPRFFEIHRLAGFSARSTDIDVVLDLMIHDLDLLLHLDGTDAVAVDAVGVNALTDQVDIANARIRMASGAVANLTASRVSVEAVRRIRVFQERTYLACDTMRRSLDRYRLEAFDPAPGIVHRQLDVADAEPLGLELAAFVNSVRDGTPPPVDGRQGRRALELALRVRHAIEAV